MSESTPQARASRCFAVGPRHAGARLDAFLAEQLGLPRTRARRLLTRGIVSLDGRRLGVAAKGRRLAPGSRVEVGPFAPPGACLPAPEPEAPLVLLARGRDWIAADKQPGRAVHPLAEDEFGTLLGAALARFPELAGVGEGGLASGVVHRLDLETSGVVVLATGAERWHALREAFRRHRVHKRYHALVLGEPRAEGRAELVLRVARHRPARVRVVPAGRPAVRSARPTRLSWRVVERLAGASLLEVDLETGFLHQIRASFSHLGHPLLGDPAYGFDAAALDVEVPRVMLHAARVAFGDVCAASPDPGDLVRVVETLRGLRPCG